MKTEGFEEFKKALEVLADDKFIKHQLKESGKELDNLMKKKATFVKGYQTGNTKRSISLQISEDGKKAVVQPNTEYAPYLEFGTRYMEAQPFVRPAFNEVEPIFKENMLKGMKGKL